MKEITKEWLLASGDDLKAAKTLLSEISLTNLVAFHAQQCIEMGLMPNGKPSFANAEEFIDFADWVFSQINDVLFSLKTEV